MLAYLPEVLSRVTIHPGFPGTVPVDICYTRVIIHGTPFHSRKCPDLDDIWSPCIPGIRWNLPLPFQPSHGSCPMVGRCKKRRFWDLRAKGEQSKKASQESRGISSPTCTLLVHLGQRDKVGVWLTSYLYTHTHSFPPLGELASYFYTHPP